MNVVSLKLIPTTDVYTTRARYVATRTYLESLKKIENRLPGEPHVYRMIDLDCGAGTFAAFAGVRFPYAWLDCYHATPREVSDADITRAIAGPIEHLHPSTVEELRERLSRESVEEHRLAKMNAQVGSRFFSEIPKALPACDALHIGLRVHFGPDVELVGKNLEKLNLAVWDWDTSERLEIATGFMWRIGLDAKHVETYAPGKGWALFFRTRAWTSRIDMNRKPRKEASP